MYVISKTDPLKCMMNKTILNARVAKWIMFLIEFGLEFMNQKFIKGQVIIDQLTKAPKKNDIPLNIQLLDSNLFGIFEIEEEVEQEYHDMIM